MDAKQTGRGFTYMMVAGLAFAGALGALVMTGSKAPASPTAPSAQVSPAQAATATAAPEPLKAASRFDFTLGQVTKAVPASIAQPKTAWSIFGKDAESNDLSALQVSPTAALVVTSAPDGPVTKVQLDVDPTKRAPPFAEIFDRASLFIDAVAPDIGGDAKVPVRNQLTADIYMRKQDTLKIGDATILVMPFDRGGYSLIATPSER